MAEYRLHCFPESGNAYKAALMLALCGADWEPVFIDYATGITRGGDWRDANNEMGEAPILEHGSVRLTQSGVILQYLSEQFGKFGSDSAEGQREILRWLLFDNHKFTSYFATHRALNCIVPAEPDPAVMAFLRTRAEAAFGVVEKRLSNRDFIIGAKPTIADISMAGYLYYPQEETRFDLAGDYPNISRWAARIGQLDGWQGPYDLMPGTKIPRRKA